MNNRDAILSAQFPPATTAEPYLELDLRDINTSAMLGRRGQLLITTKLVFKAGDEYRKDESVFEFWADVRVQGQDGVAGSIGRAVMAQPVFFGPPSANSFAPAHHDPWTRAFDQLTLELDHRQLDEIEQKRRGGPLTFIFKVGGTVQHGGRIALLYPSNNQLTYDVSGDEWIRLLGQLGYGTYVTIEVPLTSPNGLTGEVQRVMRNVDDYLVTGGLPDGDHVKKLQDADDVYELRVALDRTTWRISFWKPGGRVIILLTIFRKTREGAQKSDVDRAVRAKRTCQAEHEMTVTHQFERKE